MSNEIELAEKSKEMALIAKGNFVSGAVPQPLVPTNFDQYWLLASSMARTEMVPTIYQGKPDACFIAMQLGAEVGLSPMSSVQNIAVINGIPSIWGDAQLALVKNSGLLKDMEETITGSGNNIKAECMVLREGDVRPITREFTIEDAKTAGLAGKDNWKKYPKRMVQMRARAWALRDAFPDILRGLGLSREEVIDMKPGEDGAYSSDLAGVRESIKKAATPATSAAAKKEKAPVAAKVKDPLENIDKTTGEVDTGTSDPGTEKEEIDASAWDQKNWQKMRAGDGVKTGFGAFVQENKDTFSAAHEDTRVAVQEKWIRVYPQTPFPITPEPELDAEEETGELVPPSTIEVLKSDKMSDQEKADHCINDIRNIENLTGLSAWSEVHSNKAGSILPEPLYNEVCRVFNERRELLAPNEPAGEAQEGEIKCPNDDTMVKVSECDICNMKKGCPAHD